MYVADIRFIPGIIRATTQSISSLYKCKLSPCCCSSNFYTLIASVVVDVTFFQGILALFSIF